MRELSVYYCPRCGYYGYFQLVRNAVCPGCSVNLQMLDIRYQDFMKLNMEERDSLLIRDIISRHPSVAGRITAAERAHNHRKLIAALNTQSQELESENALLNNTVEWMHQTIWDLLARNKELQRCLEQAAPSSDLPGPAPAIDRHSPSSNT